MAPFIRAVPWHCYSPSTRSVKSLLLSAKIRKPPLAAACLFDRPARFDELLAHLLCAVVDDARAEENAALFEELPHLRGERDDDVRDDVRNDHVIVAAELLLELFVTEHIACADGVMLLADAVERGIFIRDADALVVDITGKSILCAEQQRGDG